MPLLSYHPTPIGLVGIAADELAVTHLLLPGAKAPEGLALGPSPLAHRAAEELREYLAGRRREFTVPLAPAGTPFQRAVWQALCALPYGATCSYAQLAQAVGRPKAVRAVGGANHRNPIAIFIPCHRVIGADGSLVGYGGGLALKERLLALEKEVLAR